MKRLIGCLGCALILGLTACQNSSQKNHKDTGKTIGHLQVSKAQSQPGATIRLTYAPKDSSLLKPDVDFSAYYYDLVGKKVYGHDIDMAFRDSVWTGKITPSDSAVAVVYGFKNGDEWENNRGHGYVQFLFDEQGDTLAGSLASTAYFRNTKGGDMDMTSNPDSILKWMKTDLTRHPELSERWADTYANLLYQNNRKRGEGYARTQIKNGAHRDSLSEKEYHNLYTFYGLLDDDQKQDSVLSVWRTKYPKGKAVQRVYARKFNKSKNLQKRAKIVAAYQAKIGKSGDVEDYMLKTLAQNMLQNDSIKAYKHYMLQLSQPWRAAGSFNNAAWNMAENDTAKLGMAADLAKTAIDLVDPAKAADNTIPGWPKSLVKKSFNYRARNYRDTYANILFKQGQKEKALKQQEKAVGKGKNPDINERYVRFLAANSRYKKLEKKAAQFIKEGESTAQIESDFKKAYIENHGSKNGLHGVLEKLKKQAHQKAKMALKKAMLNKKTPAFTLTTDTGKTVSLGDLKGKTVVLDFWATWCGPCRASFPGMKKAVEAYKDDPEVQFYFVNTFQSGNTAQRHQKVKNFIKQKNYPFEVLYDEKKDGGFNVAASFGIEGIPTKIIIGPEGKWRFTKVGYGGSTRKLVDELKIMISLTKPTDKG